MGFRDLTFVGYHGIWSSTLLARILSGKVLVMFSNHLKPCRSIAKNTGYDFKIHFENVFSLLNPLFLKLKIRQFFSLVGFRDFNFVGQHGIWSSTFLVPILSGKVLGMFSNHLKAFRSIAKITEYDFKIHFETVFFTTKSFIFEAKN